jgi:peptidoglycan/LPS O-acetylase OafA/YrhL
VVTAHCGGLWGEINFVGGQLAVQSFFIISGFYMSLVLNNKYDACSNFSSYKLFITNRLLRLYPIYWIVLLLTVLFFLTTNYQHLLQFNIFDIPSLLYILFTNIFIFFQDIVMFLGVDENSGSLYFTKDFHSTNPKLYEFLFIQQGWSLGIELLFYLLAPFIVKKRNYFLILLITISILIRSILIKIYGLSNDPWSYRFFPTELLFFLMGILSHRFSNNIVKIPIKPPLALFLILILTCFYEKIPTTNLPYMPFDVKSTVYLVLVSISLPILFNYYKNNNTDRNIGELSYPIYICHMLIYYVTRLTIFEGLNNGTFIIFYCTLFSFLLIKFISNPIEKIRQSRVINS